MPKLTTHDWTFIRLQNIENLPLILHLEDYILITLFQELFEIFGRGWD